MEEQQTKWCPKCTKTKKIKEFYKHKDGTRDELCKDCLTMHINPLKEDTYEWVIKRLDYPFVPGEWNTLVNKELAKPKPKLSGSGILGKYLSKMHLMQYKDSTYEDSKALNEAIAEKAKEQEEQLEKLREEYKEMVESGEMSHAEYLTLTSSNVKYEEEKKKQEEEAVNNRIQQLVEQGQLQVSANGDVAPTNPAFENPFGEFSMYDDLELPDPSKALSNQDKIKLIMKWGNLYKPNQLLELEQYYNDMSNSFDIHDADTINTLKQLAKINLKMNEAIDIGDIQSHQALSKSYDAMRKSANFTAAQNKSEKEGFVDCVGNLVRQCERDRGFIPKFVTDVPMDKIDFLLQNSQEFSNRLIKEDMGFAQEIETLVKKIELTKDSDNLLFANPGTKPELTDQDIIDHYASIEEQVEHDLATLNVTIDDKEDQ